MRPIIRMQNVWFDYFPDRVPQEQWAIRGIDLEVPAGQYIAIMGPNGSGKSTLARLCNGLLLPTLGSVEVNGYEANNEASAWFIRRTIGMVFQNPENQIVAPTVRDDVAFGLENIGLPRDEMEKRITEALQSVSLTGVEDTSPHHLSGGQKQRLSIAGVVAMRPLGIVFDESTSMLDPSGRQEVLHMIRKLHDEGAAIIHITHAAEEALQAERVIVVSEGQITLDGSPLEVFQNVEKLIEMGLEVPLAFDLSERLRNLGVPIDSKIDSMEKLVESVWSLFSKK